LKKIEKFCCVHVPKEEERNKLCSLHTTTVLYLKRSKGRHRDLPIRGRADKGKKLIANFESKQIFRHYSEKGVKFYPDPYFFPLSPNHIFKQIKCYKSNLQQLTF
jgi:hypothetical protein